MTDKQPNVDESQQSSGGILSLIGPGILIAATGVGAGDLATGAIVGSKLGTTVLWAVLVGAFLKFVLTEGLARWQLATGETILEGALFRFGRIAQGIFLLYLLVWSFGVGAALMSACGVTAHAIAPIFGDSADAASLDKIVYGIAQAVIAVVLVELGGFRLFERLMAACIGIMFVVVLSSACMAGPNIADVVVGCLKPDLRLDVPNGFDLTIGLMGGVGGTLTIICYGYWIREKQWRGISFLRNCRIDLTVGYVMTAMFGVAMVVLGSELEPLEKGGATLLVQLADIQGERLGDYGRWAFLIGGWGAVFSSLLGVWQCVPYVFADFCRIVSQRNGVSDEKPTHEPIDIDTKSLPYRAFLIGLAIVPAIGLWTDFAYVQIAYAILGAMSIPMIAVTLLVLNLGPWLGAEHKNRWQTTVVLVVTVLFFGLFAFFSVRKKFLKYFPQNEQAAISTETVRVSCLLEVNLLAERRHTI